MSDREPIRNDGTNEGVEQGRKTLAKGKNNCLSKMETKRSQAILWPSGLVIFQSLGATPTKKRPNRPGFKATQTPAPRPPCPNRARPLLGFTTSDSSGGETWSERGPAAKVDPSTAGFGRAYAPGGRGRAMVAIQKHALLEQQICFMARPTLPFGVESSANTAVTSPKSRWYLE